MFLILLIYLLCRCNILSFIVTLIVLLYFLIVIVIFLLIVIVILIIIIFLLINYLSFTNRYDYAMINFVSDEGITATCPSKILGFVRYNITKGIPTPQFSGDEELSLDTIRENDTVDNNVYVVVHTASDYVSMDQLQSDFIASFTLGNIMECVYIVNIDSIRGPLFVFKNYGSVGEDANKLFCSIPQEKWGQYFSDRIY